MTCGCHVASGLQQWEEAQEGDLWLSCCIRTASVGGGSGGRPVVVMLHQDCINGRRLRRVTCGCHVASGLQQQEEAQEGDLWLSCCIRTASMGGGSGGRPVVVMLHQDCINGRRLRRVTCGCHVASMGGGSGG